ncbi:hypothetical protein [Paratractidigestivibacter sp.]|uniref:hypothetical protein n=1 Tax=Paratractidigestivibacter sp. TaxID=2847316 RepID=UPI002ACB0E6B|nr:hypothetical protein [Paratractidigestivibacter sp.]
MENNKIFDWDTEQWETAIKNKNIILGHLPIDELLCQLAEECGELAQAALKLRRAIEKRNPTPKTYDECIENLYEEYADVDMVFNLIRILIDNDGTSFKKVAEIQVSKSTRWAKRLSERQVKM